MLKLGQQVHSVGIVRQEGRGLKVGGLIGNLAKDVWEEPLPGLEPSHQELPVQPPYSLVCTHARVCVYMYACM